MRLPAAQMESIAVILDGMLQQRSSMSVRMAQNRESALKHLAANEYSHASFQIWYLAFMKERLHQSSEQMLDHYNNNKKSLNDFLKKMPHFRAGFDASNNGKAFEYIKQNIDPELDIIKIGMRTDNKIDWYDISKELASLQDFLERYAAERGLSSKKSFTLTYNGKRLFLGDLKRTPLALGMKDGDVISVSLRPSPLPDRAPLKQPHEDNKPKFRPSKGKSKSGCRKKPSHHIPPGDEIKKQKKIWMDAIAIIFAEARPIFLVIRQNLDSMNLKRTPPKYKNKTSKHPPSTAPISNPPTDGLGGKAGKSYFVVQVGEAENLYKTAKPSGATQSFRFKHTRERNEIDLHGLTKKQALEKLDAKLPGWIDMAMGDSYPFVIQVTIICGGGNQTLAKAVENWIYEKKSVANARKSLFS